MAAADDSSLIYGSKVGKALALYSQYSFTNVCVLRYQLLLPVKWIANFFTF